MHLLPNLHHQTWNEVLISTGSWDRWNFIAGTPAENRYVVKFADVTKSGEALEYGESPIHK